MRVLVCKHLAQENLGTLKAAFAGFRLRYVNFHRDPEAQPSIEKYDGLVLLGGPMGVYEADRYPHLLHECQLVESALKRNIPILGICLGSQILAHVLGSHVRKHQEREVGWQDIELTTHGQKDALFSDFSRKEKVFQMHGDTFDIPKGAVHLARSSVCESQGFRYGEKVYGLQFHHEIDRQMIERFLRDPGLRQRLELEAGSGAAEKLERDTVQYLARSLALSHQTFTKFTHLFGAVKEVASRISAHGKMR